MDHKLENLSAQTNGPNKHFVLYKPISAEFYRSRKLTNTGR